MTPEQLIRRYQALYGQLQAGTQRQIRRLWVEYGGLTDAQADRFVVFAAPVVTGAQIATGRLVAGYMAAITRQMTGKATEATIQAETLTSARGVDVNDVYRRPVVTARVAISDGVGFEEAMTRAEHRAGVLAVTDIALAQRAATLEVVSSDSRIVGYRRTLTGKSCAYCATASTQRYFRGDLSPLHPACDCGVAPIIGDKDPGRVINRERLQEVKTKAAGDPEPWKAKHFTIDADDRISLPEISVRTHGELGPVLVAKGHAFSGPDDLAA